GSRARANASWSSSSSRRTSSSTPTRSWPSRPGTSGSPCRRCRTATREPRRSGRCWPTRPRWANGGWSRRAPTGCRPRRATGAGQGPLALVAEIIAGELARRLGLRVPELVLAELDPRIAVSEPDPEIQDLLRASEGVNLGVDFLPGSFGFDPLGWTAEPEFASQVLWLDALVQNVDRTWRNPNLLVWHRNLCLIAPA